MDYNLVEFVLAVCIIGMLVVYRSEVTGFLERSGILNTGSARYKILFGTLVAAALILVINPEIRVLLLLLDAIGIDVMIMLILIQLRVYISILVPVGHRLSRWVVGRVRRYRPSVGPGNAE